MSFRGPYHLFPPGVSHILHQRDNPEQAGKTDFPISPGNKQEVGRTISTKGASPLLGACVVEAKIGHGEASLLRAGAVEGR